MPQRTVAYKAGWSGRVTTPCASAAIDNGAARPLEVNADDQGIGPDEAVTLPKDDRNG
jgi:hypothetical protein